MIKGDGESHLFYLVIIRLDKRGLMNKFIRKLKKYREILPRNILKTIRGQALSGDLDGAIKGLDTALKKYRSK